LLDWLDTQPLEPWFKTCSTSFFSGSLQLFENKRQTTAGLSQRQATAGCHLNVIYDPQKAIPEEKKGKKKEERKTALQCWESCRLGEGDLKVCCAVPYN